ncbi:MAG TPA: hypothetical protein VFE61_33140 [Candidatus Sulfotelmatobacter sp.]|nr:hypothetical protein [Candidatus Sulfotelmatobacter sp.]
MSSTKFLTSAISAGIAANTVGDMVWPVSNDSPVMVSKCAVGQGP